MGYPFTWTECQKVTNTAYSWIATLVVNIFIWKMLQWNVTNIIFLATAIWEFIAENSPFILIPLAYRCKRASALSGKTEQLERKSTKTLSLSLSHFPWLHTELRNHENKILIPHNSAYSSCPHLSLKVFPMSFVWENNSVSYTRTEITEYTENCHLYFPIHKQFCLQMLI